MLLWGPSRFPWVVVVVAMWGSCSAMQGAGKAPAAIDGSRAGGSKMALVGGGKQESQAINIAQQWPQENAQWHFSSFP
eukprot:1152846-Pelagomonas_calceolata.AAC.2